MSTRTAPRYSTRELQAAAQALAAGQFATGSVATPDTGRTVVLDESPVSGAEPRGTTATESSAVQRVDATATSATGAAGAGAGRQRRCGGIDDRPRTRGGRRRRWCPDAGARRGRAGVVRAAGCHSHRTGCRRGLAPRPPRPGCADRPRRGRGTGPVGRAGPSLCRWGGPDGAGRRLVNARAGRLCDRRLGRHRLPRTSRFW